MGSFEWISPRPLPTRFDLRGRGWRLAESAGAYRGRCAGLVDTAGGTSPDAFAPAVRRRSLALSLASSSERTRWLAAGFADALPEDAALGEIEQRALRVIGEDDPDPGTTRRQIGPLSLDLVERDARCEGRRVRLHPREFALLWRLCETQGEPVSSTVLLREVWDVRHRPETNSIAVHVCRLRRKLTAAGLPGIILTEPGGYRLQAPPLRASDDEPRLAGTAGLLVKP